MGLAGILPFLQQYMQQAQALPPGGVGPESGPPPPDPTVPAPAPTQAPAPDPAPAPAQAAPASAPGAAPTQQAAPTQAAPPPPVPAQTKGRKLLQILQGGLMGGLSGVAANAQTYAQTGRNAGFGGGVGAGFTQSLPMQSQMQQAELGGKQAQTALMKSENDPVNVPGYGMMPGFLVKQMGPAWIQAQAKRDVAETGAAARTGAATIGAQGRTGAAQIGADARIQSAKLNLGPIADVPQDLQEQFGLPAKLPLKMLNQAESAANKPLTIAMGEAGPAVVNKQTKATSDLGLGSPRMGGVTEVADTDNPGQTKVVKTSQAAGSVGKGSASVAVARGAAMSELPKNVGDQKVAFTTMIQHAALLRTAYKALNNGDVQALNGLENAFKNEFGYSGPITGAAIADAYKGEVAGVLNKGHITDTGSEKVAHTLDLNHLSPEQADGVFSAYQALGQSKLNMLNQQQQAAVANSQPKKPAKQGAAAAPNAPEVTATGPGGHKIALRGGKWVDAASGNPIQ